VDTDPYELHRVEKALTFGARYGVSGSILTTDAELARKVAKHQALGMLYGMSLRRRTLHAIRDMLTTRTRNPVTGEVSPTLLQIAESLNDMDDLDPWNPKHLSVIFGQSGAAELFHGFPANYTRP
jgi:NAD(P)H-dependent flavin oxidoreductase YrpB (nitropropane dioxygenase family)